MRGLRLRNHSPAAMSRSTPVDARCSMSGLRPGERRLEVWSIHGFFRVQDQQQVFRQLVDALDQRANRTGHSFGRGLEAFLLGLQHVTDFVDEQTDGSVHRAHDYIHGQLPFGKLASVEAAAKIYGHHNLSAKIDEPADDLWDARNPRHLLIADDFLDLLNGDAKELAIDKESTKLRSIGHG